MATSRESHVTENATGTTPEATTARTEIPESVLMPVFILGLLIVSALAVVVLGFVGFSDLMPHFSAAPPPSFH
jgi:hypothetical protein